MDLENQPNFVVEKYKWHNRLDEAYVLSCLYISLDWLFHIDGLMTPNQVWTKLESLFGVQDEIRAHRLRLSYSHWVQAVLISIEGLFTKFKSCILFLKNCGIKKKVYQLILYILSKLSHEYSLFVSTFHATRLVVYDWKMPSLCTFFDSLIKE